MSLRMISLSFILSETCGRAASGENMYVESIFSKWNFVQVLLFSAEGQNTFCRKTQVTFCHPSQRNENIKMWETHPNDYRVFSKIAYFLSLIPWSSTFQDGGWVKFPTLGTFRMSNSLRKCASLSLIPVSCPPPPLLGQTIDRCISLLRRYLWSFSYLSLARIKASSASFLWQKIDSPSRFLSLFLSSLESFSAKLGEHVICINPAFSKMIHGTKDPKSLLNLQNAQCDTTNFALKGTSTTAKCDSTFPWVYPSVTVRYDFFEIRQCPWVLGQKRKAL